MNEKMKAYLGIKEPKAAELEKAVGGLMDNLLKKAETTSEPDGENTPAPVEDGPIMKSLKKAAKKKK